MKWYKRNRNSFICDCPNIFCFSFYFHYSLNWTLLCCLLLNYCGPSKKCVRNTMNNHTSNFQHQHIVVKYYINPLWLLTNIFIFWPKEEERKTLQIQQSSISFYIHKWVHTNSKTMAWLTKIIYMYIYMYAHSNCNYNVIVCLFRSLARPPSIIINYNFIQLM